MVENQSCESQAALRLDLGIVAVANVVNTEPVTMPVPDPPDVREVPSRLTLLLNQVANQFCPFAGISCTVSARKETTAGIPTIWLAANPQPCFASSSKRETVCSESAAGEEPFKNSRPVGGGCPELTHRKSQSGNLSPAVT